MPISEWKSAPRALRASSTSLEGPCAGSAGTASPRAASRSQGRSSLSANVIGVARDGVEAPRRGLSGCSSRSHGQAAPDELARHAEILEPTSLVVLDPGREHRLLPRSGGQFETLELVDHGEHAGTSLALSSRRHVLPLQQEPHVVLRGDGFDLAAQPRLGVRMDPRKKPPCAPLLSAVDVSGRTNPRIANPSASRRASPMSTSPSGMAAMRARSCDRDRAEQVEMSPQRIRGGRLLLGGA